MPVRPAQHLSPPAGRRSQADTGRKLPVGVAQALGHPCASPPSGDRCRDEAGEPDTAHRFPSVGRSGGAKGSTLSSRAVHRGPCRTVGATAGHGGWVPRLPPEREPRTPRTPLLLLLGCHQKLRGNRPPSVPSSAVCSTATLDWETQPVWCLRPDGGDVAFAGRGWGRFSALSVCRSVYQLSVYLHTHWYFCSSSSRSN